MTEFYILHQKNPCEEKGLSKKKAPQGHIEKTALEQNKAPQKKSKMPFFLPKKKAALDSNMPRSHSFECVLFYSFKICFPYNDPCRLQ